MIAKIPARRLSELDDVWFVSGPGGANGIASDDVISGILVMGGGGTLVASPTGAPSSRMGLGAQFRYRCRGRVRHRNERVFFGAGDPKAAGAANDAVFTWLHQDIGLFLLPAIVLVMLAVERLVKHGHPGWIGWTAIVGTSITFLGGLVYVFVTPALYGPSYIISTVGLVVVGMALECVQKDEKQPIERRKRRMKPKRANRGEAPCA